MAAIRRFIVIPVAIAALAAAGPDARATESFDGCDFEILTLPAAATSPGVWCVKKDLGTSIASGAAITVSTSNVTIDCGDNRVSGLGAGDTTTTFGILAQNRLNLVIRNCHIRGFYSGVQTVGGGGHLLERNHFEGNTVTGVSVESPNSTIRDNLFTDTGNSLAAPVTATGIFVAGGGIDVLGNTVRGVRANGDEGASGIANGIFASSNLDGSITGNRVRGLFPPENGSVRGIVASSSAGTVIEGNHVQLGQIVNSTGITCSNDRVSAVRNSITGATVGINACLTSGNVVNAN
jgi:hypothetical protein